MAVFPILKSEPVVQVGDKIRLLATQSFATPDNDVIVKVEIRPSALEDFIEVTGQSYLDWYLDWVYLTDTAKLATVKITTADDPLSMSPVFTEHELTQEVKVLTAATDYLFSTDSDLRAKEHDIEKWIPDGYSSWNHVHRQAQKNILDWLDELRIFRTDGTRFQAADIVQKEQVRRLSIYMVLRMIFSSISNQVGDVFDAKRVQYQELEFQAKLKNNLLLDFTGLGDVDAAKRQDMRSFTMVVR